MDRDEKIDQIVDITSLSRASAAQYLDFAKDNVEAAITLYFEDPNLARDSTSTGPSSGAQNTAGREVIPIDSDDDQAFVDDEALARQLQDAENSRAADPPVRDPVARRTDVLLDDYASMPVPTVRQAASIWGNSSRLGGLYSLPEAIQITRDLDSAKDLGRRQRKHLLVDMQLPSVFDCSCLVRDLWNDPELLNFIVSNFIFVQYTEKDGMWENFRTLYMQNEVYMGDDAFPYAAVLDSLTGELIHKWVGKQAFPLAPPSQRALFDAKAFKSQLESIVSDKFSRDHFAGLGPAEGDEGLEDMSDLDEDELPDEASIHSIEVQPKSRFDAIPANDFVQPPAGPEVTSVQIRYPSGQRKVRRFRLDDQVQRIYEWLKANPMDDSYVGREFQLIFRRDDLIDRLEETIEQAGLKMANVFLELGEAPEEMGPKV